MRRLLSDPVWQLFAAVASLLGLMVAGVSLLSESGFFDRLVAAVGKMPAWGIAGVAILMFAYLGYLTLLLAQGSSRRRLPAAYNVALLGFPAAGKTTLITVLLNEIFAGRLAGVDVKLTSESTIDRFNEDLSLLQQGMRLPPTRGDDIFAYRADFVIGRGLGERVYQVQIGDFPGEDTVEYIDRYGPKLHGTPFFKWATQADALIFLVDLRCAYPKGVRDNSYVAKMSAAIRTAWQNLLIDNTNERRRTQDKQVVLLFSKVDAPLRARFASTAGSVKLLKGETSEQATSPDKVPEIIGLDEEELTRFRAEVVADFGDLIIYMNRSASHFQVVFSSAFARDKDGLVGIPALLKAILPRS